MRALVLAEIGRLAVEERAAAALAPDEVRLRVVATGICGSDIHGFTGENGRRFPGQVMGHETVGRVDAVGTKVSGVDIGAPATFNPVVIPESQSHEYRGREQHSPDKTVIGVAPEIDAAFADYVTVPARNIVSLPEDMPIEYGALIEPLAVAVHAVRRVLTPDVSRALVVGGGPIGQSAVIALTMHGVKTVYVSELDPARRALCERLGATVLDPKLGDVTSNVTRLGGLVDVAIDAVGISPTLRDAVSATKFGGSVCLVGMGSPELSLDAFRISTEERTIVGSFTYSAIDFTDAAMFVAHGDERFGELISRQVAPNEADAAFRSLASGDGTAGKVLVRFDR
ncbi:zinc-dependent alcohol dehydrogenase [Paramicrobacterium chengjingii]|uniref:Alcohol dehydrogenase catalytic domain-containing protein n=1 Tax=Paramicrobacterium chengjingii TaxID=2769067 RepID=A0ABX6YJF8_9MICO|nr:zinc-binding dehydrogenase [Microbacterium chengjingii]QPZ38913.1 alcohol dehydrogenase catalytic domain-containing protein [Microbacterium chengjingii]